MPLTADENAAQLTSLSGRLTDVLGTPVRRISEASATTLGNGNANGADRASPSPRRNSLQAFAGAVQRARRNVRACFATAFLPLPGLTRARAALAASQIWPRARREPAAERAANQAATLVRQSTARRVRPFGPSRLWPPAFRARLPLPRRLPGRRSAQRSCPAPGGSPSSEPRGGVLLTAQLPSKKGQ
jgi:hypothetical protein